ncbi:glycosyltransferase family 9 protein [Dyadobacter tibetensis]|uniref:glycosyltransferase family 9 protein n=1 Tax=Dyadobacter tibetensis TaxID=1211851 RepID=UPI00047130AB|nr:glycosyltransferase family 9 protein [Dyadobacter tibetensis]
MRILITRTDAIGDVVLTLPVCGIIKKAIPGAHISILARPYTRAVIEVSDSIDAFVDYTQLMSLPEDQQLALLKKYNFDAIIHLVTLKHISQLAQEAGIGIRIGTVSRPYHWHTCNELIWLRRKASDLHEAQLHCKLIRPLTKIRIPDKLWEYYQFRHFETLPAPLQQALDTDKFRFIIHPKSNKNALEWDLAYFSALIRLLDPERFQIYITGSEAESIELQPWMKTLPEHVVDLTGRLTLSQLISFINEADGLLAASTGPLHLAAACGIHTLGLYPNQRPKHAGRWGPIGPLAEYIQTKTDTLDSISPEMVFKHITLWKKRTVNSGAGPDSREQGSQRNIRE